MIKVKISSAYDPRRRPVLDEDAQHIQKLLINPLPDDEHISFFQGVLWVGLFGLAFYLAIAFLFTW